jgi:hypothetical protein
MKAITVSSDRTNPGCKELQRSLKHFGYDFDHIDAPFEFGGQMKHVYEWCKANWGWFIYTDAWDTFALAEWDDKLLPDKMLISAEKNCYPHAEKASRYPECKTEWKYVNGGGFLTTCEYFVKIYEESHQPDSNDQDWLTEVFLAGKADLDTKCVVFQTIAFEGKEDFSRYVERTQYTEAGTPFDIIRHDGNWPDRLRMRNNFTNSLPIFIHGNAHTPLDKIYKLL